MSVVAPATPDRRVGAVSGRTPLLLMLGLVAAVNAPSLRWPFMTDDWALLHVFQSPGGFRFFVTPIRTPLYRPVSWGGAALQHSLFGLHPLPYHLVALAFVLGTAATLYRLALQLGLRPAAALLTGVAYGAHPALAWGVGWMCCVGTPMGELFAALALRRLMQASPTVRDQLTGTVLMVVAIGCHETFAVFPAVLLLLRLGLLGARDGRAALRRAVTGVVPCAVVAGAIVITQAATKIAQPPNSDYTEQVFSPKVIGNAFQLLENLSGGVLAAPNRLLTVPVESGAAAAWLLLLIGAVVAARTGRWLAVAGLIATIPCTVPAAILVNQTMNPYYLEVALLPLAIAIGVIAETVLDLVPAGVQLRLAVPVAVAAAAVGAVVMTQFWSGSFLGYARARQDALIAQEHQRYGDAVPPVLTVADSRDLDDNVTYRGLLFNVLLHDPGLKVVLK